MRERVCSSLSPEFAERLKPGLFLRALTCRLRAWMSPVLCSESPDRKMILLTPLAVFPHIVGDQLTRNGLEWGGIEWRGCCSCGLC